MRPEHRAALEAAVRARTERPVRKPRGKAPAPTEQTGDLRQQAGRHVAPALDTLVELMDDDKSSVRLQAALSVLHYAYGKPVQHSAPRATGPKASEGDLLEKLTRLESAESSADAEVPAPETPPQDEPAVPAGDSPAGEGDGA